MKLNKIFAIALAALTMTACSDDDEYNTASAVVEMGETTIEAQEDFTEDDYYKVPIVVTGETNGPISVTVEVTGSGDTPATENENYIITQKTITIPAGSKIGYIEFHTTGDWDLNPDRKFIMTITSAQGATIGQRKSTLIALLDDETLFVPIYATMGGLWIATDDANNPYYMTLTTYPEDDENYLRKVNISGWAGISSTECDATVRLNPVTNEILLQIPVGTSLGMFNFTGLGVCSVFITGVTEGEDGKLSLSLSGNVNATSNTAHDAFVFRNIVCGGVFNGPFDGNHFQGTLFLNTALSIVKAQ